MYPDILPPKDWCRIYRKQIYPLIDEDKSRDLYSKEKVGRPNKSVKTAISILKKNWCHTDNYNVVNVGGVNS